MHQCLLRRACKEPVAGSVARAERSQGVGDGVAAGVHACTQARGLSPPLSGSDVQVQRKDLRAITCCGRRAHPR